MRIGNTWKSGMVVIAMALLIVVWPLAMVILYVIVMLSLL